MSNERVSGRGEHEDAGEPAERNDASDLWTDADVAALDRAIGSTSDISSAREVRRVWQSWASGDDRALVIILELLCKHRPDNIESWVRPYWLRSARSRAKQRDDRALFRYLAELGHELWPEDVAFQPLQRKPSLSAAAKGGQEWEAALRDQIARQGGGPEIWKELLTHVARQRGGRHAEREHLAMVQAGVRASTESYNVVLGAYGKQAADADAERVFAEMLDAGHRASGRTFDALIAAYCANARFKDAERMREQQRALGVTPNVQTYSSFVHGYSKAKRFADAERELAAMRAQGLRPSRPMLAVLLTAYVAADHSEEAEMVLAKAREGGEEVGPSLYCTLFAAHAKSDHYDEASRAREHTRGREAELDSAAYGKLIHGHAWLNEHEEVDQLLLMLRPRHSYNEPLCKGLLTAYEVRGQWDRAEALLQTMIRERLKLDQEHCLNVLYGCANAGHMDQAERLRSWLTEQGVKLKTKTLETFIHGYVRAGQLGAAERELWALQEAGHRLTSAGCAPLIKAFIRADRFDDAERVVATLERGRERQDSTAPEHGRPPPQSKEVALVARLRELGLANDALCGQVVNACVAVGRVDEAEELYAQMQAWGRPPNALVRSALVRGHAYAHRFADVARVLDGAEREGLALDEQSFAPIFRSCFHADRVDLIVPMFARMIGARVRPSTGLCLSLLDGLAQREALDPLRRLMSALGRAELQTSSALGALLARGYLRLGEYDRVWEELEQSSQRGEVVDLPTFNALAQGYARSGRMEAAMRVLEHMVQHGPRPDHRTYGVLLDGCARADERDDDLELTVSRLLRHGLATTELPENRLVLYNSAIKAFGSRRGLEHKVDEMEKRILDEGLTPDRYTTGSMASLRARQGLHRDERLQTVSQDAERWKELTVITGDLVHELSQPLGALGTDISSAREFIRSGLFAEALTALDSAARAKSVLADRVQQYDALAGSHASPQVFDAREVIVAVAASLRQQFRTTALRVGERVDDVFSSPLLVRGTRIMLEIALKALLSNALQALADADKEQPIVLISAVPFPPGTGRERQWVDIRVRDNGPGVPADLRSRIFEYGFSTKKQRGLGLGLSLAHNVANLFEGTLSLMEDHGAGAEFWLRIRAARPEEDEGP